MPKGWTRDHERIEAAESILMATDWIRNVLELIRAALYVWALSRLISPNAPVRPATR